MPRRREEGEVGGQRRLKIRPKPKQSDRDGVQMYLGNLLVGPKEKGVGIGGVS